MESPLNINISKQKEEAINGFQVEVRKNGKLVGYANYFKTDSDGDIVWGSRVDVNGELRQGIATKALIAGDNFIRNNFPGSLRAFNNLNNDKDGYYYNTYLNQIPKEHIIRIDSQNRIIFKLT